MLEYFSAIEITIPLSQLVLLLILTTLSLLFSKVKIALLVNYIFALYWGYFLNREMVVQMMGESDTVAFIYFGLGIGVAILAGIGFIMRHD